MDNRFVSCSSGRTVKLKTEVFENLTTIAPGVYKSPAGHMFTTKKVPGLKTLEKYCDNGIAKTPCGCKTEPDAPCIHEVPNWLMIAGVI